MGSTVLTGVGRSAQAAAEHDASKVIVQFAGQTALASAGRDVGADDSAARAAAVRRFSSQQRTLRSRHRDVLRSLAAHGVQAHVRAEFTGVFNGLALRLPSSDVARLRATPGVVAVYPDVTMHVVADDDVSVVRAPETWATDDPTGHPTTGTGQVVAVVDTGVDYTHPDLGGGLGAGRKVVGGYDFVNGDSDPMDDNGHGTHVAGIVAGEAATPGGRAGVAPGAALTAYKVFSQTGYGDESVVIEGLEAAVDPANPNRADVVNLSLAGPGDGNDPLSRACESAIASGVVVVAAAGNNGPGESSVTSPGVAPDVLSVGASVTGVDVPVVSVISPVRQNISTSRLGVSANPPEGGETLDLVDVGRGDEQSYEGRNVAGKAVLMAFPQVWNYDRYLALAAEHRVKAVILYTGDFYSTPSGGGQLPRFSVSSAENGSLDFVAVRTDGTQAGDLKALLDQGPVRIHIGGRDATDLMPAFSAHGPAPASYRVKPDLVAPGVEVRSTWIGGGYRRDSGTSMAAPHVAGAAALLLQAHPDWTPDLVASALTGSAHRLASYDVTMQGAGRLDVAAADAVSVVARPRAANLGLADLSGPSLSATTTFTLTNVTGSDQDVRLRVQPSGKDGTVTVVPDTATLAPHHSATFTVSVTGAQPERDADIQGWVGVTATGEAGQSTVAVPYLLAVRHLALHASPDPTAGDEQVFIYSEPDLATAPEVVITAPNHQASTRTATFDHGHWWRVDLPTTMVDGVYDLSANAKAASGQRLTGKVSFEKISPPRGQSNAGWQPIGPDGGGYQMAFTPARHNRMYVTPSFARRPGIFRTDQAGDSWHELRALPNGGVIFGVAADPHDGDTVYLAENGNADDPTYQGHVLVSHDAGRTWTTLPGLDVPIRDMDLSDDGQMLVVTSFNGSAYLSTDQGAHWRQVTIPGQWASKALFVGANLVITTYNQVYVLRDVAQGGSEPTGVFTAAGRYASVTSVAGAGNMVVVGTFDPLSKPGLFVSRDGGSNWAPLAAPPGNPYLSGLQLLDGDVYAMSIDGMWTSPDGNGEWTSVPTPVDSGIMQVGRFPGDDSRLLVAVAGFGVYATADLGRSYHRIGVPATSVNALAVTEAPGGADQLVAGTDYGTYTTPMPRQRQITEAVRDWGLSGEEEAYGERIVSLAVDPTDAKTVYRYVANAFSRFNIEKSSDGGATWDIVEQSRTSSIAHQIAVSPADHNRVYATLNDPLSPGVLVSADGGRTWRKNSLLADMPAMLPDPDNPDGLWLGGRAGLFYSDDAGRSVTRLSDVPVDTLAVDPRDPDHLLVGGDRIYLSFDGGNTLSMGEVPKLRMRVTSLLFGADGTMYAGTGSYQDPAGLPVSGRGVLKSTDGGRTWHNVSVGLADLDVTSLAQSPDGAWVYAGTVGGGVYRMASPG